MTGDQHKTWQDYLRRLFNRPKFDYQILSDDIMLCRLCDRMVGHRQMVFHSASKHGFSTPDNIRIERNQHAKMGA